VDQMLELVLEVKAAQRAMSQRFNEAVRPLGVSAVQAEAILWVGELEPVSLKELGSRLVAESGHPSRLVDRLVEAGLLSREANKDDHRRVDLRLTARGREIRAEVRRRRQPLLEQGSKILRGHDVAATLATLRALSEASNIHR
jgi:MarR family transcriptional regulator, organic hydroperoxide resistance regulator